MRYQIQIHFVTGGQYIFEYEPDKGQHINDFMLQYDKPDEKFLLTGDEQSTALVNTDSIAAIIALPLQNLKEVPTGDKIYKLETP